jgi:hypothetical protein
MRLARARAVASLAPAAALTTFALAVGVALGRRREARMTSQEVDRLLADGRNRRPTPSTGRRLDDLPTPVQRYFDSVFEDGPAPIRSVRIEQEGTLRLEDADSPWKRFTATHRATVRRPGFVWDATVDLVPGVSVRVRDSFVDGDGSARVALFGALPVAGASPGPELNEAALQRYLAEAVWYPTALLPRNGVRWNPVDDRTARATLAVGGTTASLTFSFSESGEVERVHADRRYRSVGGRFEPTPWTGTWRDYEVRNGVRVPTEGEVVWHLPAADLRAWRGRATAIEFEREPGS